MLVRLLTFCAHLLSLLKDMPPNRGARTEHWLATHGARLVRRAEQEVAGSNFAVRSGDKIKEWIQT